MTVQTYRVTKDGEEVWRPLAHNADEACRVTAIEKHLDLIDLVAEVVEEVPVNPKANSGESPSSLATGQAEEVPSPVKIRKRRSDQADLKAEVLPDGQASTPNVDESKAESMATVGTKPRKTRKDKGSHRVPKADDTGTTTLSEGSHRISKPPEPVKPARIRGKGEYFVFEGPPIFIVPTNAHAAQAILARQLARPYVVRGYRYEYESITLASLKPAKPVKEA